MSPRPRVPERPRPVSAELVALLQAAGTHRLHLALVLVGVHRVPPGLVLDLTWPEVDWPRCRLRPAGISVQLDRATMRLLSVHGARQRLDRVLGGPRWQPTIRVFTDPHGLPWHPATVDETVAIAATTARPWVPTLAALRDLDPPPGAGA